MEWKFKEGDILRSKGDFLWTVLKITKKGYLLSDGQMTHDFNKKVIEQETKLVRPATKLEKALL